MPDAGAAKLPTAASAAPNDFSDFDRLLEKPASRVAAPSASGVEDPRAMRSDPPSAPQTLELATAPHDHGPPTWGDFRAGWNAGIYQDPVLCAVLAGLVLGPLGIFVVLRRAVFVTAAISQSAALGVALALLFEVQASLSVPPVAGAIVLALLTTAVLAARPERVHLPRETALGFAYVAASAAALLAGDRITQEAHDISAILFGTAVLVRPLDLGLVAAIGIAVVLALFLSYRGLVFAGFDAEGARVHGLPVQGLELLLWVLVALEVAVTTRALGALPVFALAVLPAMAALGLVERLKSAFFVAAVCGGAAGALGYLFAFFFEFPVGASQAAVATLLFLGALGLARVLR